MDMPKTIAEMLETISKLRSRRAILQVLITHLRHVYMETNAGPPEQRILREDHAFVPKEHIEQNIIETEHEIELIDARLEELQNVPIGGGAAPAATAALPAPSEDDAIAEAVKAQQAGAKQEAKKGPASGKSRPQGSRPD